MSKREQEHMNEVLRHSSKIHDLERKGKHPRQIWTETGLDMVMSFKTFFQAWYFPMEDTMSFGEKTKYRTIS